MKKADAQFLEQMMDIHIDHQGVSVGVERLAEVIQRMSPYRQLDVALDILHRKGGEYGSLGQDAALCLVTRLIGGIQKGLSRSSPAAPSRPARSRKVNAPKARS